MSCTGSERAENTKGFGCRNMGEVLGKECVKEETSFAHSPQNSLREVGDSAASSGSASESGSDKELSLDSDEDISWLLSLDTDDLSSQKCKCEGCLRRNESITGEKKNAKLLLSSWKEFQSYIRHIYINSPLESAPQNEIIPVEENERLHEVIQVMRLCDPYQLFQKIEDEVQAMVLRSLVRQLNLLKDESNPSLAEEFITGLIEEYVKLLSSAVQLSPAVEVLVGPLLRKFGATWDMLNKHLYQSIVYLHYDVQKNLPQFIGQLRTMLPLKDDLYHELVHQYLAFDDEMSSVGASWKNIEPLIQEYKNLKEKENETLSNLQDALKAFFATKLNTANGNVSIDEGSSFIDEDDDYDALQYCPNCLTRKGCPCDECTVTHMISCEGLDSPSTPSSSSRSRSPIKIRSSIAKNEIVANEPQSCECHACTVPPPELMDCSDTFNQLTGKNTHGEGFQLYPHIHGTVTEALPETDNISNSYCSIPAAPDTVYPHLYNLPNQSDPVANVCQVNDSAPQLVESVTFSNVQPHFPVNSQPQQIAAVRTKMPDAISVTTHEQLSNCSPTLPSSKGSPSSPKTVPPVKNLPNAKPVSANFSACVPSSKPVVSPSSKPSTTLDVKITASKPTASDLPLLVCSPSAKSQPEKTVQRAQLAQTPVNVKSTTLSESDTPKQNRVKSATEKLKGSSNSKGANCLISSICGKCCLRHGPDCMKTPGCDKNSDKDLTTIAKLGLASSNNSRGALRCTTGKETDHSHKPGKGHSCGKLRSHDIVKKTASRSVNGPEHEDSSGQDDTCSERSNSTSASTPKDSRHCDCCYCEVFGHGVPSVAPVSRNYQEMRERLRIRLNVKKCKAGVANESAELSQKSGTKTAKSQGNGVDSWFGEQDLDTLLKYIEGQQLEDPKDTKKEGKKARQKQKKLEEKERREEEEANKKRLEAMKKQVTVSVVNDNKRSQTTKSNPEPKLKSKSANTNKNNKSSNQVNQSNISNSNNSKTKKKNNNNNNNNNNKECNSQTLNLSGLKSLVEKSDPNSEPKMVTIRRVMAPFSAEPTVTITLKGSTPDKDKVLFMLKNGSETFQSEEKKPSKKSKKKKKKSKKDEENCADEDESESRCDVQSETAENPKKKKRKKNKNLETNVEMTTTKRGAAKMEQSKTETNDGSNKKITNHKDSKVKQQTLNNSSKTLNPNNSSCQSSSALRVPGGKVKSVPVLKTLIKTNQNREPNKNANKDNSNCVNVKNSNSSKGSVRSSDKVAKDAGSLKDVQKSIKCTPVLEKNQKLAQKVQVGKTQPTEPKGKATCAKVARKVKPTVMNQDSSKGERVDKGKVVINTPSYRLSEVLSSIAPSPPPKEEINLENLRLPPGITITKIEGPITKSIKASDQPLHVSKPVPMAPPIVVATPTLKQSHPPPPGNVIVVDTGRLKEVIKENSQNAVVPSTATVSGKKKKKKSRQSESNEVEEVEVPMSQATKFGLKMTKGNPLSTKSGVTVLSADEARKMVPSLENQQATIIKTSDNMVTIRSPAFQQAMNMHAYQNNGPSFRPGINGYNNVSLFRSDVDRLADSIEKLKASSQTDEKLAEQMRNLNIKEGSRASELLAQAMAAAEDTCGKKKKKKKKKQGGRSDEKEVEAVESVFQPKDIDLENGDIDDDERELEAFKRFCLQSVPSERKNKVKVNLNIKDIVLKKKSSAIGCS